VIAAFDAVGGYARAEAVPSDALPPVARRSPAQDHARLARTLGALLHLADQFEELSFGNVLRAANKQYRLQGTGYGRAATAPSARMANEAISICDRGITAPRQYHGGRWPPDTLSYLHAYASSHGLGFESAVASLTTRLLAGLRHYADHQSISFQEALAAGLRAHARQRLREEGAFQAGQDPGQLASPESPVPVSESFPPTATSQGVVISAADAEWLLTRTAARNQDRWHHWLPASRSDADDERVLAEALAAARGQATGEIFTGLAPQIAARVMQIEDGPAAAAALGSEHGRAGVPPYCEIEDDGDVSALLGALGETEPTTGANGQYRVSLVRAYAEAYQQAARHSPPPAGSPARIAARDFPRMDPAAGTPCFPGPGRPAQATPQAPRRGPRTGPQ
jgi:hypothetical protein